MEVLMDPDLLSCIITRLSRREALRTSATCTVWNAVVARLDDESPKPFRPRMFVACSRLAKVLDVDPDTAAVRAIGRWDNKRHTRVGMPKAARDPNWITGICVNPEDGDIYACQYKVSGVLRFSGRTMQYKHVAVRHRKLEHPEGIAFALGSMYVQTNWGCVSRLTPRSALPPEEEHQGPDTSGAAAASAAGAARPRPAGAGNSAWVIQESIEVGTFVTWGMCQFGDGLYLAYDRYYPAPTYTVPPDGPPTGGVMRVALGPSGQLLNSSTFTQAAVRRPSGVRFDPAGRLWVTSMEPGAGLMCFAGPGGWGAAGAGDLLASLALEAGAEGLYPWDVVVLPCRPGSGAAGAHIAPCSAGLGACDAGAGGGAAVAAEAGASPGNDKDRVPPAPPGLPRPPREAAQEPAPEPCASAKPVPDPVEGVTVSSVAECDYQQRMVHTRPSTSQGGGAPARDRTTLVATGASPLPRGPLALAEAPVTLVATMHCGRSMQGRKQEKDCRLAVLQVVFSLGVEGKASACVTCQRVVRLPADLDHANMCCTDL